MSRICLALSGGGFRATLFHLGVVRYLHDVGRLQEVTTICGVSGGSILAAFVVDNWPGFVSPSTNTLDAPFRRLVNFIRRDVRGRVLRRTTFLRSQRTKVLQRELDGLYKHKRLSNMPDGAPTIRLLATNMSDGALVCFSEKEYATYAADKCQHFPTDWTSTSLAVAASAAFPAIFPPVVLTARHLGMRGKEARDFVPPRHYISDGGILDNVGYKFIKETLADDPFDLIIISDASGAFEIDPFRTFSGPFGLLRTTLRSTDIMMSRIAELEQTEGLPNSLKVSISCTPDQCELPGLSMKARKALKYIRTDLDAFSPTEIYALVAHGQSVAEHSLGTSHSLWPGGLAEKPPLWNPLAANPLEQQSPQRTEELLENSSRRRTRLFQGRDPFGTAAVFLFLCVLGLPVFFLLHYTQTHESFRSFPFTFELSYPDHLSDHYRRCFKVFKEPDGEDCRDLLDRAKQRDVSHYAAGSLSPLEERIRAQFSSVLETADTTANRILPAVRRYCSFYFAQGKQGAGNGYLFLEAHNDVFQSLINSVRGVFVALGLLGTETKASGPLVTSLKGKTAKGFILFRFSHEPEKEHGFAFVASYMDESGEITIDVAQPPNHGRKGGLWQARLSDVQLTNGGTLDGFLMAIESGHKGESLFNVRTETDIPLFSDTASDAGPCQVNKEPGLIKFATIQISTQ
ncbi:MAG: patatin-like phospholipase family protein [Gammaproteobacteria bacterium]|nr:patatin-like phospholipase family protein [Gammaproteobacteria bacterium]